MAIVDIDFYDNVYIGEAVATADFPRYEARAEDIIAGLTKNKINEGNIGQLPAQIQGLYKKAVCAQIEYFQYTGITVANYGNANESFTTGKVSVSSGNTLPTGKKSMVCPLAFSYLEQTGLLNPQVDCIGAPFLPFWYGGEA